MDPQHGKKNKGKKAVKTLNNKYTLNKDGDKFAPVFLFLN